MNGARDMDEGNNRDMLAAEYVLGVLGAEDRMLANRLMANDPEFLPLVEAWRDRLGALDHEFAPVQPAGQLKQQLEDRLFAATTPQRTGFGVAGFWRPLALVTTALLLLVSGLYAYDLTRSQNTDPQRLVATLAGEGEGFPVVVLYEKAKRELLVTPIAALVSGDHDLELWVIKEGQAPVSLGLVPGGKTLRLPLVPGKADMIVSGDTLAITLEPKGGAPDGKPTGPVLGAGKAETI